MNPPRVAFKLCVSIHAFFRGENLFLPVSSFIQSFNRYLLTSSQPWLPASTTLRGKGKNQKIAKGLSFKGRGGINISNNKTNG